jgi:hypothetical protein
VEADIFVSSQPAIRLEHVGIQVARNHMDFLVKRFYGYDNVLFLL